MPCTRSEIFHKSIMCAFIFKDEVWGRVWYNKMRRHIAQSFYKKQALSVAGDSGEENSSCQLQPAEGEKNKK